ncbi:MAG: Ig-like domain-containing protein [Candidatus Roizmanbacteria bacterium]|nr:MAG: Ig-like domain-containing protein [Candidatus Roizmanbacteria bacterium]
MNRKFFYVLMVLVVLISFSGFFWFYETQYMVGRADVSRYSFSADNSYIFVSPLQAKANGQEKIRITVFILNNQGLGVMGKKVTLEPVPHLSIEAIQGLSDNLGKSVFDVTANQAGEYYVSVKVEDTSLNQKAHVSFN